ncbi:hypothetical protein DW813_08930 [Roseburia inulinivorans]|uniref:Uncharacterized protein n=1 Tax=Roseburia inulinivorans TaxID=360807 RepID=A0A396AF81_9FIRM|nr:hypothetical protein DW813_08930 [Roseburia inulinivorans]
MFKINNATNIKNIKHNTTSNNILGKSCDVVRNSFIKWAMIYG